MTFQMILGVTCYEIGEFCSKHNVVFGRINTSLENTLYLKLSKYTIGCGCSYT
jgi:hypothetical protein